MDATIDSLETAYPALTGRRILVVEDEYFLMDDLCRDFTRAGAGVAGVAGSVTAATELIDHARRIDAAVLDVNLAGEMAYAVADRLVERAIPFVFTTGYDTANLGARYPHAPCVQKPARFREIAGALATVLGR